MVLRCLFLSASLHGPCLFFHSLFGTFLWACCRFPSRHTPSSRGAFPAPLLLFSHLPPPCMDFVNQSVLLCQCFHACLYTSLRAPRVSFCLFLIVSFFLPGPPSYMCLPVVLPAKALLCNLSQIASTKTRATIFLARAADLLKPGVACLSKNSTGTSMRQC